jgi:hypothetical protein
VALARRLRLRYLPNGVNTPFWTGVWQAPGKVKHAAIVRHGVFTVFGGHGGPCVHTVAGVKPAPAAACCTFTQACEHRIPLCGTTPQNATGWVQHSVCGRVGTWLTGGGQMGKHCVSGVGATMQIGQLVAGVGGQHWVCGGVGGGGGVRQTG